MSDDHIVEVSKPPENSAELTESPETEDVNNGKKDETERSASSGGSEKESSEKTANEGSTSSSESESSSAESDAEDEEEQDTQKDQDSYNEPPRLLHVLDALSDHELVKFVDDLKAEVRHLDLENMVFEHFLQRHDPALILGMAQILETAMRMQVQKNFSTTSIENTPRRTATEESMSANRRADSNIKFVATTISSMQDKGPR